MATFHSEPKLAPASHVSGANGVWCGECGEGLAPAGNGYATPSVGRLTRIRSEQGLGTRLLLLHFYTALLRPPQTTSAAAVRATTCVNCTCLAGTSTPGGASPLKATE